MLLKVCGNRGCLWFDMKQVYKQGPYQKASDLLDLKSHSLCSHCVSLKSNKE